MGLFKTLALCSTLSSLFFSCSNPSVSLSHQDRILFENSLKTEADQSLYSASDHSLSYYNALPRDLNDALAAYSQSIRLGAMHDYEYLQKLGIRFLKESVSLFDPEEQLLSVYGASIAKNDQLIPLLGEAVLNPYPQVQLAAVRALSEYQDDLATKYLLEGLNSNYLEVAFETLFILCSQKHPDAMGYIQSLMHKVPEQLHILFPTLYALIDTPQSTQALNKMLHHSNPAVQVEAILAACKCSRDDLLETIRTLSKYHDIKLKEACALALGHFQDESSLPILEELSQSSCEQVALSAHYALYRMGRSASIAQIESFALQGNLYALSLLKDCPGDENVLEALVGHTSEQVRLGASLALLKKKNLSSLPVVRDILIPKDPSKILTVQASAGKAIQAKKWAHLSQKLFRENPYLTEIANQYRQEVLIECADLPENVFLALAEDIIQSNQNELIPLTIRIVQSFKTAQSLEVLKNWQQRVGSPFVRNYSNLALYELGQEGPWKEELLTWVTQEQQHPLIRLKPMVPWSKKNRKTPYEMTPEEKSQLLIESYLALAAEQEEGFLELVLSQLSKNSSKNKLALAGILLKATD